MAQSALRTIGDSTGQAGAFAQLLGMSFEEIAAGRCIVSLHVKQHLLNPHGIAHGGVTFSLADSACGGAALSALGSPRVVTQDMQIRYHGPVKIGQLIAEAEVIHFGTRTITTQCRVSQGEIQVASTTATFAILSEDEVAAIQGEQ